MTYGQAFDEWMNENAVDPDNHTDEEFDAASEFASEAESEVLGSYYSQITNEVENYLEELFEEHGLDLRYSGNEQVEVICKDWDFAAAALVETINGVGDFEYEDVNEFIEVTSRDGSAKSSVLSHLHWIGYWQEVYGGGSSEREIEKRIERALRYM